MVNIDIVIPTHNSSQWIDQFIESVLNQDNQNWQIITRDDGSTDDTAERMRSWAQRLGDKITIISNPDNVNCGPVGSYNILLGASRTNWIMLADPDDIWKPNKISATMKAMLKAEKTSGADKPIVIFTDAEVIDEHGQILASSYWKWSRLNPKLAVIFHRMIVESSALSSTMMVNRATLNLALPVMGSSAFQDWWLALVASAFGKIVYLSERTISYRRHSSNDSEVPLTASSIGVVSNLFSARQRVEKLLRELAPQAAAFAVRFREQLPPSELAALEAASKLPSSKAIVRRLTIIRHGLWFASPIKNIGLLLFL